MSKMIDQEMKDRVVRLIEDRILAEGVSLREACRVVGSKLGCRFALPGSGCARLGVRGVSCEPKKVLLLRMRGCAGKTRSWVMSMSC